MVGALEKILANPRGIFNAKMSFKHFHMVWNLEPLYHDDAQSLDAV